MIKTIEYKEGMKVEPGNYYLNMPNDVYHSMPGSYSKSGLDTFHNDPYKFFNPAERKQTRPMELGSAIHAAILEPNVFAEEYMLIPEVKDRRQSEYKMAVAQFGAGKVFTNDDCKKIEGMQKAVHANDEAHKLLTVPGFFEVSGFSVDEKTGLVMRHRFDKLALIDGEWFGVDLKKTQGSDQYKFSKSIYDYRYHVQYAIYSKGFKEITGIDLSGFIFIAVEDIHPHKVAIYELCDISKKIGRDEARMDLDLLAEYKAGNITAHNNSECEIISLPEFVLRQHEDELI
jgi:hypothetical protein